MSTKTGKYQVLARKYRPSKFSEVIGQEALVRVIGNSFKSGRIAQAFILTGVRGVGKTTTARLLAKGMNCIGRDGEGAITTEPCNVCIHCQAIAAGNHLDVLEMDAASRTGVNDIRELLETVHYQPNTARYKVYIIDEVHMLSKSAFNALLKTLEEPPEHVVFIFATTEIRMVPVTILSRCQRFDLRRIEPQTMTNHLNTIATKEGAEVDEDAMRLLVRAAEGSVRDGISLLDQSISFSSGKITAEITRNMLGLTDKGRILDLVELIFIGDAAGALEEFKSQYNDGADPQTILMDLAETIHFLSVVKINSQTLDDPTLSPEEKTRGQDLSSRLSFMVLHRAWQMLLKIIQELTYSPDQMMAAEMAMIRLTHAANLPTPLEIIEKLQKSASNQTSLEQSNIRDKAKSMDQSPEAKNRSSANVQNQSSQNIQPSEDVHPPIKQASKVEKTDEQPQVTKNATGENSQPQGVENNELVASVLEAFPEAKVISNNSGK